MLHYLLVATDLLRLRLWYVLSKQIDTKLMRNLMPHILIKRFSILIQRLCIITVFPRIYYLVGVRQLLCYLITPDEHGFGHVVG